MDLKEAGKLLGLTANAVRSRAEKGKYPFENKDKAFEKDNQGKWFVFLDPEKITNDPASNVASNGTSNGTSRRGSNASKFEGEIKALQGHVKTLSETLGLERAEVTRLRVIEAESVDLKVENASLKSELQGVRDRLLDLQKLHEAAPNPPGEEVVPQAIISTAATAGPGEGPERGKGMRGWLARLLR